jgi:hypothetical protein
MKSRLAILTLLSVAVLVTLFVLPYGKVGSVNPAWAQQYQPQYLGTVSVRSTCPNANFTGVTCSYETGYGYATFTGGCNYAVYRMTQYATLLRVLDTMCVNNQLQFMVSGTGHYFFYPLKANPPKQESTQYTVPLNFQP